MKHLVSIILLGVIVQATAISQDDNADAFQLLRRIYLNLADRTPTQVEVNEFIADGDLETLTDRLLAHEDFRKTRDRFWRDYLKVTEEKDLIWLRGQVENNSPVDARLREWFSKQRTGSLDSATSADALSKIAPTVLGVDLQCAQCHDHPWESWTMMSFMQLAGFMNDSGFVLWPDNHIYVTPEPGSLVPAETPFGEKFKMKVPHSELEKINAGGLWSTNKQARSKFGDWLTDLKGNPIPLEVLAARYVEWLTGRTNLADDIWKRHDDDTELNREISPFTKALKSNGYDEAAFIRSLVKSPVFVQKALPDGKVRARLMAREQWLNSIESALGSELENGGISENETAPGPLDPFIVQAEFVDTLLATHEFPADADVLAIWLETLTRPPRPEEIEAAEKMINESPDGIRDLYGTLFLSDEFQTIP